MEQATTTPDVRSPGVDGRMFLPSSPPNSTLLTQPLGRHSLANFTTEVFLDDDPSEDWTRTMAEKDSLVHSERRRSSVW
jgi:hypothetical protein